MNAVVGDVGVEALDPGGDRPVGGGRVVHRGLVVDRDEHVDALGPARLHGALEPQLVERLVDQVGDADDQPEVAALGRIEVDHQVGDAVGPVDPQQGRVVLDGPLVGEPQQRAAVVADGVGHVALGGLGPEAHRADPVGRVLGDVLLHERLLPAVHPDHRQRPVLQDGHDAIAHLVEVVDQIALRRVGPVEQRLVEVGELDPLALLTGVALALGRGHTSGPYPPGALVTRAGLWVSLRPGLSRSG
jgi:hypothetical protein